MCADFIKNQGQRQVERGQSPVPKRIKLEESEELLKATTTKNVKLEDVNIKCLIYAYLVKLGAKQVTHYGNRNSKSVEVQFSRDNVTLKYNCLHGPKKPDNVWNEDWELSIPVVDIISCHAKLVDDDTKTNSFFLLVTEKRAGQILEQFNFKIKEGKKEPVLVPNIEEGNANNRLRYIKFFTSPIADKDSERLEAIFLEKLIRVDTATSILLEGQKNKLKKYEKLGIMNCANLSTIQDGWILNKNDRHYAFKCSRIQLGSFVYDGKNIVVAGHLAHSLTISMQHIRPEEKRRMAQVLIYLKKDTLSMAVPADENIIVLRIQSNQFDIQTVFSTELGVPSGYLIPNSQDESQRYVQLFIEKESKAARDELVNVFKTFFNGKLSTFDC